MYKFLILNLSLLASFKLIAAPTVQVGVVDMQRVILSVEDGKKARSSLEKDIKAKEGEFRAQKEELDKLNREWKDQAALLSEDARIRKQKAFQEKFLSLRNEEMKFQTEIKKREAQATQKIAMKVSEISQLLAKKKKLDMVFEASSAGLIYVKNPTDLTDEIIKSYGTTTVSQTTRKK